MTRNMGTTDRVARLFAAALVAGLYFTDQITGLAVTLLGIFAVVFLFTGTLGFCPLYVPFKLTTRKRVNPS